MPPSCVNGNFWWLNMADWGTPGIFLWTGWDWVILGANCWIRSLSICKVNQIIRYSKIRQLYIGSSDKARVRFCFMDWGLCVAFSCIFHLFPRWRSDPFDTWHIAPRPFLPSAVAQPVFFSAKQLERDGFLERPLEAHRLFWNMYISPEDRALWGPQWGSGSRWEECIIMNNQYGYRHRHRWW
jgi:hypothetical protein